MIGWRSRTFDWWRAPSSKHQFENPPEPSEQLGTPSQVCSFAIHSGIPELHLDSDHGSQSNDGTSTFSLESVLEIAVGTILWEGVVVEVVDVVVDVVVLGNVEVVVKIGQLCSSDESSQSRFPSQRLCDSIHSRELTHRNCH